MSSHWWSHEDGEDSDDSDDPFYGDVMWQCLIQLGDPGAAFQVKFQRLKNHLNRFLLEHLTAVCKTLRANNPKWLEFHFGGDDGQWRRLKAFFKIAQNTLRSMEQEGLADLLQDSIDLCGLRRSTNVIRYEALAAGSILLPRVSAQGSPALRDQTVRRPQTPLDVILQAFERNIREFVSEELTRLQEILTSSPTADPQRDHGRRAPRSSREEFLTITEDILRRTMHEEELADTLQSRLKAAHHSRELKRDLQKKFQCVFEGITKAGSPTLLKQIYTELYITEGEAAGVNEEHEVRQIEAASRRPARPETPIRPEDIFKAPPGRHAPIRTVLTKGVAGIGKTVLTQKFTLDWAEDKAKQDMDFTFPFTFRELNLLKDKKFSLVGLVHHFFPQTKEAGIFKDLQVVFIFDGLDECRLPLDFHNKETLTDVTESTSVDVLLTNLIRRNLLPSARLWITTRPAAANHIPPECVSMVTEVRGFTDPQKEEYFRKRFRDEEQATTIISHIRSSRSLHIMCHIPVFCWISATVLEDVLKSREGGELPKTLTEMYIHFLLVQTKLKKVKYDGGAETDPLWNTKNRRMIKSLGKLAFEQLQKGNLIFYESDLTECGLDVRAASVCSGVFTQIFREERRLYQDKVFCFVHLSVQEFLAALHVHLTFIHSGVNLLAPEKTSKFFRDKYKLIDLYQNAVDEALRSPSGHLDLFLRFLLGLSQDTNQSLLQGLLEQTGSPKTNLKIIEFIKTKINKNQGPPERIFNLFHCLNELNDDSLVKEIQQQLRSGRLSTDQMSPVQWSALTFILLSSEEDLDVFDLRRYAPSEEGLLKLLPVVRASSKALLNDCKLTKSSCRVLAKELCSLSCNLRELDLSHNDLGDAGVKELASALTAPSQLERLRLSGCRVTEVGCAALAAALRSKPSRLTELDLSNNRPGRTGEKLLSALLEDPVCSLKVLWLDAPAERELLSGPIEVDFSVSDWTKVTPAMKADGDTQTFSLNSGAGRFECSLSRLRWVCKATVCFQYQFCSWKEHGRRPPCLDYEPAGPLINITVTDGTLHEMHLPHWLCRDEHHPTSDMFAVLHVDSCGSSLEKASEVTQHHVTLLQPEFSTKGVMFLKRFFRRVKMWHDVLIYKTNQTFLTLHVYLLPPDRHLQKEVESRENSDGSDAIRKPSSSRPFQMNKDFFLKTDQHRAHVTPPSMKLRKVKRSSAFFEVFLRDVQDDFTLSLEDETQTQDSVWTCTIRRDDYRRGALALANARCHFVDQHRTALIHSVCDTNAVLDQLLDRELLSEESYAQVRASHTTQEQMRLILRFVSSAGDTGKDALYTILRGMRNLEPLITQLERS